MLSVAGARARASGAHGSNLRRTAACVRKLAPPVRTEATGGVCRCVHLSCQSRERARAPRVRAAATSGVRRHVCASSRRRCAQRQPAASAAVLIRA
eukprot:5037937-Pleurochrysis_carterae.AAC.1